MGIVKAFRYPVSTSAVSERTFTIEAPEKPGILGATPPELGGKDPEAWSPEELFVGAIAACYRLTLVAFARRREVPLSTLRVDATGHLEHSHSGGYAFTVIELEVDATTDPSRVEELETLARRAKELCIVGRAVETPIHLLLRVRPEASVLAGVT